MLLSKKMNKYKEVGDRIKHLRGPDTQPEFAKKLGLTVRSYQRYEAGERMPKRDLLDKIAAMRNIPVDFILYGGPRPLSFEEYRERVRYDLWLENPNVIDEDIDHIAHTNFNKLSSATKDASIAAELHAHYGLDVMTEKVLRLMKEMSEEEKKAILKYAETQKHLVEELKKKTEQAKPEPDEKAPRPIPIEFNAEERYALHLYELAEKRGLAHKLDEIIERLLSEIKDRQEHPGEEPHEQSG